MKLLTITSGIISLAIAITHAADVTYSVVAFPGNDETVAVSVANKQYPLQKSTMNGNLFSGVAPFSKEYRYTLMSGTNQKPESTVRHLTDDSATATGNEFFNRSRTVYDIPELPQAYNQIYPGKLLPIDPKTSTSNKIYIYAALASGMGRSNEVSTLLLNADMKTIDNILKKPLEDHEFAQVFNMSYISHDAIYNFQGAGIKNSGQSSKDLAKQSLKIKFNKFNNATKDTIFGRRSFKLRAEANDPTMVREKLMLDCLAAAGATTLQGNWVRLYINNEPFGLYLMYDDTFKGFTENLINAGNKSDATGATFKGNAMSPEEEANLVYKGSSNTSYNFDDVYILEDEGRDKSISKKSYTAPLINFMERLNKTVVGSDAQTPGTITDLMDSAEDTMIQTALSFLAGSWDGFWYQASNYYLNQNTQTNKWYLITYDFDETFGNGLEDSQLMTVSYQNYSRPGSKRPLVDMFVKSAYYEPKFQDILKTIVKRFFNPRVIKPRLDAWTEMLKEDIAWDYSLPFRSPGEKEKFTVNDFANNMHSTVGDRMGVLEWVSNRTSSLSQQLNFNDTDDLKA
jgi:hypothetical protein